MAAAVLFRKVQERGAICVKMALCIAMAVMVMATVYRVNDIVAKGNPVWLYNEENVGTIRAIKRDYALKEVADSCRPVAVAVSIAGTVAISGAYFWRKRKEEQDA